MTFLYSLDALRPNRLTAPRLPVARNHPGGRYRRSANAAFNTPDCRGSVGDLLPRRSQLSQFLPVSVMVERNLTGWLRRLPYHSEIQQLSPGYCDENVRGLQMARSDFLLVRGARQGEPETEPSGDQEGPWGSARGRSVVRLELNGRRV